MSAKERHRLLVMEQVRQGVVTIAEACERLGVCYRQARRIAKRFREQGEAGLAHRSRDRASNRRLGAGLRQEALALYQANYADYGPTLASEVLAEEHGVGVHAETLRRWLRAKGRTFSAKEAREHRRRRARRPCYGELVQMDGSDHDWFEGRGARCVLMVAVDDATGRLLCRFSEEETLASAYGLLRQWIERRGVPEALYVDRRSMYVASREPTAEEKRAGTGALTDFGRACAALGIEIILARSPQAKGRVERMNGVLQDRLVKALRRKGIGGIAEANAFLPSFLAEFERRFSLAPASAVDRHGKRPSKSALNELLCREEDRQIQNDWTITYEGAFYQIEEKSCRPRQKVTVRRRHDGSLAVLHEGRRVRFREVGAEGLWK